MRLVFVLVVVGALASCGDDASAPTPTSTTTAEAAPPRADAGDGLFPNVVDAAATSSGDGTWDFSATISSPCDSPDRYADAWRIEGPDGSVLGVRELLHDHASEQPFTRSLTGVAVDASIEVVTIEGRDQVNGWGGQTFELRLTEDG